MAKMKVCNYAKACSEEFGSEVKSKDIMEICAAMGLDKKPNSNIEDNEQAKVHEILTRKFRTPKAEPVKSETPKAETPEAKQEASIPRPRADANGKPIPPMPRPRVDANGRPIPPMPRPRVDANGRPIPPMPRPRVDANGNPIPMPRPRVDANGRPIPPMPRPRVDANGNPIPMSRPRVDANGRPIPPMPRPRVDANGRPIPMPRPRVDANGNPVPVSRPQTDVNNQPQPMPEKNDEKLISKENKELATSMTGENTIIENSETAHINAAEVKPSVRSEDEKKSTKPVQGAHNGERRPANQNGDRRNNQNAQYGDRRNNQNGQYGDRRSNQNGQYGDRRNNHNGQNGDRRNNQNAQYGDRRNSQGGQFGDRRNNQNAQFGDRRNNQGGQFGGGKQFFNKDMFDKDKDAQPQRSAGKRNDYKSSEKSSIKAELANEITKEQRAAAFNNKDRDKDKNKGRNREMEDEERFIKSNKKGAFIMPKPKVVDEQEEEEIRTIYIPDLLTVKELAEKMHKAPSAVLKKLLLAGKNLSVNKQITFEEAQEIALEYNCIAEKESKEQVDIIAELMKDEEEEPSKLEKRPPVVCVMGHVDHGKTSLLDAIRKSNVTSREAGGITQHIGAYIVDINGERITFLDTPGHEAFTSMRMRGAKSTDIAILVVAADDGVMPQTVEAISHAKAAGVQIIVAVNKMDKPSANIEKIKQELTEHELIAEDWGGETVFVPVSAKTGEGIQQLLEMVLLTAEMCELKANPDRRARGIVIEAELDKGRGPVATILVQKGTLHVGDNIVIGSAYGKVRAMMDDKGRRVKEATPSMPIEILGLNEVPAAGEIFMATANEKEARTISDAFISQGREMMLADTKSKLSLDGLFSQIQAGNIKELNLIIKADVQGSVEAVKQSLVKLSNEEVAVRIIHGGVGAINESDVNLASASNAIIIGFNVRPDNVAKDSAEREKVDVRLYKVIYNAIEDVEAAMKGMLDPVFEEKVIGHAEVRQLFKASGLGTIAGSYVLDGKIVRGCSARITRAGEQIYEGPLASLKRFKDDVKEVAAGYECGLVFEKFNDLAELDIVELYTMVEVKR